MVRERKSNLSFVTPPYMMLTNQLCIMVGKIPSFGGRTLSGQDRYHQNK